MPIAHTEDGVDVAWYDLAGPPSAPSVLLAHATGFHGKVFTPLAAALTRDGAYHCVAFDERGHGDTPPRHDGSFDWHGFARDALAVVDAAGLGTPPRPFGIGHSAGGAALLLAELARPGTFRAIYCYEPIVAPVEDVFYVPSQANPLAQGARHRRAEFASKDAAFANYASKPPMATFHPDALRAYVDHGFREIDGGVRLKCEPESEARTYEMGMRHGAFARFPEIRCPVTVAYGTTTTTFGPEAFALQASRLPAGRVEPLDGLGHFGPFEDPERVAASVRAAFAAVRGA